MKPLLFIFVAVMALSGPGCGQTGPLELPQHQKSRSFAGGAVDGNRLPEKNPDPTPLKTIPDAVAA